MAYANSDFYINNYLIGKQAVITTAFDFYARKASKLLDKYTFGRINAVTEEISMCCCEIAELLFVADNVQSFGKSSESVGGWSVSYSTEAEKNKALNEKCYEIAKNWLSNTNLLYRGVDEYAR